MKIKTLEKYGELLKLKKDLEFISQMLKSYTDKWAFTNKKILEIEKELEKVSDDDNS